MNQKCWSSRAWNQPRPIVGEPWTDLALRRLGAGWSAKWEVKKQQEEICWLKRETVRMRYFNKYYYAMKSQYNNISMLKLKQLSKTIRRRFLINYLSIVQRSTIDNKEWWRSYSTTGMFNTPRATTRKGGLILYSSIGQTTLRSVSDNTG